jgi:hypothetical protein
VGRAAIEVSRINREMHTSQLDRYLTAAAGISFQHTPFIIHTKRLANATARREMTEILDSLFYCIKVLKTARDSLPGADTWIVFTLAIAKRVQLTLLFDQESKLLGISLDSHPPATSIPSPPDIELSGSLFDPAPFAGGFLDPLIPG